MRFQQIIRHKSIHGLQSIRAVCANITQYQMIKILLIKEEEHQSCQSKWATMPIILNLSLPKSIIKRICKLVFKVGLIKCEQAINQQKMHFLRPKKGRNYKVQEVLLPRIHLKQLKQITKNLNKEYRNWGIGRFTKKGFNQ